MIFSLDPGAVKIGWSITNFEGDIVSLGLISPLNNSNKSLPFNKKMNLLVVELIDFFEEILNNKGISHVVWEIVPSFGAMSQRELIQTTVTTLKVLTFQRNLPYQQFTPRTWHKEFAGKASATKDEVKALVLTHNLHRPEDNQLPVDAPYDVYDAIAIGLTAGRLNDWITNE